MRGRSLKMEDLIMKHILSKFFKLFFSSYYPRYPLRINDTSYRDGEIYYQIIAIGEQRPIIFSAQEILSSKKIKERLLPDDLIIVATNAIKDKISASQYHLTEINRNDTYALQNKSTNILISGEEFCRNVALLEQTCPLDIYRITSNFYFNVGRNLEKLNGIKDEKQPTSANVLLTIVK